MALTLPLISLCSAMNGYFTAVRRVSKNALTQIFEQGIKIVICVALLTSVLPSGIENACLALVLGGAASEIFSAAGPEVASFIRQSMVFRRASNGSTTYFLNLKQRATEKNAIINNASPEARFAKILPEARNKKTLDTIMFCSPTAVLRMALPRIAAKLPLKESVLLQTGVALLRKVRGDGLGYMVWSEGGKKRIFFRMSNDELRGTARLWSLLLL
jgi:hypothetical protein